jgi:hypothetical protein
MKLAHEPDQHKEAHVSHDKRRVPLLQQSAIADLDLGLYCRKPLSNDNKRHSRSHL